MSDPVGYLRQTLREGRPVSSKRADSYGEMEEMILAILGMPSFFVIEHDENQLDESDQPKQDALYFYDGIDLRPIGPGDITVELRNLAEQMTEDRIEVSNDTESVGLYHSDTVVMWEDVKTDKVIVGDLKTDVLNLKSDTNTIKTDTIAIRDAFIATLSRKIDTWVVANKAAATTLIATPNLDYCVIIVLADDSYGGGLGWYFWNKSILTQNLTF